MEMVGVLVQGCVAVWHSIMEMEKLEEEINIPAQDSAFEEKIQNIFHAAESGDLEKLKFYLSRYDLPIEQCVNKVQQTLKHRPLLT